MYGRSTTMRVQPDDVDAVIAMVRDEVMPAVQAMDGCVGLSLLVNRETGVGIVTAAWADEEALRSSAQRVGLLRDRAAERFGSRPEVQEWEIAVLHRARETGDGACARVTWTQTDPSRMEEQLEVFRSQVMPRMEAELPGFCSVSLLIDRSSGRGALTAIYESKDALARTRDMTKAMRADATRQTQTEVLEVAEFEVALAHLRVPETV